MFKKSSLRLFLIMMPVLAVYLVMLGLTMDSAKDRENYLNIAANPFEARVEPGYKLLFYGLSFIIPNEAAVIYFVQTLVIILLLLAVVTYFSTQREIKTFIVFFVFLTVFAVFLGVQIRFGLAMSMVLFIIFAVDSKPTFKLAPIYLLAALVHYGVIPFILFYYFSYRWIFNVRNFVLVIIGSILFWYLIFYHIPEILGLGTYYTSYFLGEHEQARTVPYLLVYYVCLTSCSFFISHKRQEYWVGLFGVIFFPGLFALTGSLVLYKMMAPFVAYATLVTLENFYLRVSCYRCAAAGTYVLMFLSFLYFGQTTYILE